MYGPERRHLIQITGTLQNSAREKTYSVTQDDVGSKILLTITGLEDKGYTGSLKAETAEITAVSQEPAQTEEK